MKELRIAILISSRGSNMHAILNAIKNGDIPNTKAALVVSDNKDAKGLITAKEYGVRAIWHDPSPYKTKLEGKAEDKLIEILKKEKIDLICLAGFMRLLKSKLINEYKNRILNVHPSLLPKFPGLNAQKQAIDAKASESGCTIHFVDEGMDTGPIIAQSRVPVEKNDDEKSLSKKILKEEHKLYPKVLKEIALGLIKIG